MLLGNMIEQPIKCEGNSFLLYASPYVTRHGWKTFAFPKPSHNDSNAKFRIRIGTQSETIEDTPIGFKMLQEV